MCTWKKLASFQPCLPKKVQFWPFQFWDAQQKQPCQFWQLYGCPEKPANLYHIVLTLCPKLWIVDKQYNHLHLIPGQANFGSGSLTGSGSPIIIIKRTCAPVLDICHQGYKTGLFWELQFRDLPKLAVLGNAVLGQSCQNCDFQNCWNFPEEHSYHIRHQRSHKDIDTQVINHFCD